MPLHFLLDDPASPASAAGVGDELALTGAEAHHAATVRRVRVGEQVTVGEGRGTWLIAECVGVDRAEVVLRVVERRDVPALFPRLVLVQALAKGDRDELAIQAATELGVDEIVPWQAARSVSRWDAARAAKGQARWTSIVREAAKQAHRAWLPLVAPLATTAAVAARAAASRVVVLDPTARLRLVDAFAGAGAADVGADADADAGADGDVVIVVGPEGGIADEELMALESAGARRAVLGDTVLRTSTAGPAALAVASAILGRW